MMADYCWSLKRDKLYQHLSIIRENQGKEVFFGIIYMCCIESSIFDPLNLCSVSVWRPCFPHFFPNCTLFDVNTVFFIENTNFYWKRRGKHFRMTKFVWEGGGRTIFGLASGKASKRGCEGGSRFQPLPKRLNVVLSMFIWTFPGP